ncbi:TIGR00375 family protein [Candidatus Methanoperedens nitroreducens]|uniref:TIGR00375 family protein n=1 Tax=Candidatus Methanoperedens nitratireducens TaxID=1392998 RepID=A0A062VB12_9EURY|nr:TIGR00375 family protein [Candidatus Methanoperedens nitroreducens]KCZ73703.1 TIGR00375 family protein [Candidatus Methanoperedens nitroreducens]MDJ1422338.1 TIGR00375 family protein [Candidatus Methanoperedens sp.]
MQVNADLHIHSKYSAATSTKMDLPTLAAESRKKGIQLVATGDCLHPEWLAQIKKLKEENGIFKLNDTSFILTTEVEDINQVHHLLIVPSISKAEELYEFMRPRSNNIDSDGRPNIRLSGEMIARAAMDAGALIGPAHAFTPWTAMYAYHNSLRDCYGDLAEYIYFIELGLSADTSYADRIPELRCLTFLSNSDAHSPYVNKLAREFNRFEMNDITFDELRMAIIRERGRKPILNVGLPPEEGKYNESACIRCYKHYTLQESITRAWRCSCGGVIKKGVRDRVNELASYDKPRHPSHRPRYLHLIPLSEIIAMALGMGVNTKSVQGVWNILIERFGSEVAVLVDADIRGSGVDNRVIDAIIALREGKVTVHPGGGGQYGRIELTDTEPCARNEPGPQKSLFEFVL